MRSFSPPCADFAALRLLCLPREEPGATPLELLALLLLELPLLLTLAKAEPPEASGERSHQLTVETIYGA